MPSKKVLGIIAVVLVVIIGSAATLYILSMNGNGTNESKFKVAIVLPGLKDDLGWNQQGYDGLTGAASKYDVQVSYSESVAPADAERVIRNYASEGYNLIFAHDYNQMAAAINVARDFPNVKFAWGAGYFANMTNLCAYDNPQHYPAYIAGVLAAKMTESGVIGIVTAYPIPAGVRVAEAFKLGVKAVDPSITVKEVFAQTFTDTTAGYQTTVGLINNGADVILSGGDGLGIGIISACRDKNVFCIGACYNQQALAPKVVLASVDWANDLLIQQIVDDTMNGNFPSEQVVSGDYLTNKSATYLTPMNTDIVPQNVIAFVNDYNTAIMNGTITVPLITQQPS